MTSGSTASMIWGKKSISEAIDPVAWTSAAAEWSASADDILVHVQLMTYDRWPRWNPREGGKSSGVSGHGRAEGF